MKATFGLSWGGRRSRRIASAVVALAVALLMPVRPDGEQLVDVIVRSIPGQEAAAVSSVRDAHGTIGRPLELVNGFTARIDARELSDLRRAPGVLTASLNQRLTLMGFDPVTYADDSADGYAAGADPNSLFRVLKDVLKVNEFWGHELRGEGIDVAMIDSGVVPVDGLTAPGAILNGPDLSFESQFRDVRYLDTFGHGTHLAGIIGGRDNAFPLLIKDPKEEYFAGVAPGSRIVSLKVADAHGETDVSQVIAAIAWVIAHNDKDGLNIRVLNLSFGTDGVQDYTLDPLTYAVEQAWRDGIVVVVAAGNSNFGTRKLNNPAYDPFVIAVGAAETYGTYDAKQYTVPDWSATGDGTRNPDLVAPGRSIVSLRAPGSNIDEQYPGGRVAERYFRGSGTSQAAAVVSGAAALVLQKNPTLNPDQVKRLLTASARPIPSATIEEQGAGVLDLERAYKAKPPTQAESTQLFAPAVGGGSIDASRGSLRVEDDSVALTGEKDIFSVAWKGMPGTSQTGLPQSRSGSNSDPSIMDVTAGDWSGKSWSGKSWSGMTWSGKSWSGKSWSSLIWSGKSWSGKSWSGKSWSSTSWSGASWSGKSWSGKAWASRAWD